MSETYIFFPSFNYLLAESQILTELSIDQLDRSAVGAFPATTKRQHVKSPVQIVKMQLVPFVKDGQLLVRATATNGGRTYNPSMVFSGVTFEPEDTDTNVTFTGANNSDYHIQPIDSNTAPVKVRCDCMDFYWRFAMWNYNADSLNDQPPPPYQKKTNRPPVNPRKAPGLCKHLMKLTDKLEMSDILD